MAKDYYQILGLEKTATKQEIKKKFRELAKKYHPDISKEANSEEKYKEIQEAYNVLYDEEKRKQYDSIGSQRYYEQNYYGNNNYNRYEGFNRTNVRYVQFQNFKWWQKLLLIIIGIFLSLVILVIAFFSVIIYLIYKLIRSLIK